MSFKGSSAWKAEAFREDRQSWSSRIEIAMAPNTLGLPYVKRKDGWILFGPQDIRSGRRVFNFALQRLECDKTLRVRVGCRFYTLPQAWKHWSKKAKHGHGPYRNEGRQALVIIQLMILQAQAYGLLRMYAVLPKFDSSIVRKKRK